MFTRNAMMPRLNHSLHVAPFSGESVRAAAHAWPGRSTQKVPMWIQAHLSTLLDSSTT
eukprot:COSAG04_NODE_513_length_13214_cov_17.630576_2_plen_58_part_00